MSNSWKYMHVEPMEEKKKTEIPHSNFSICRINSQLFWHFVDIRNRKIGANSLYADVSGDAKGSQKQQVDQLNNSRWT